MPTSGPHLSLGDALNPSRCNVACVEAGRPPLPLSCSWQGLAAPPCPQAAAAPGGGAACVARGGPVVAHKE